MEPTPSYVRLYQSGELRRRVDAAVAALADCRLCARRCGTDRQDRDGGRQKDRDGGRPNDRDGECRLGRLARVSSAFPHMGEEGIIRGTGGSGTIFLAGCSLHCKFCQNFEISHDDSGRDLEPEQLAGTMAHLASQGCHNFNFVTPTHCMPQILEGLLEYLGRPGARPLPIVWNTGGYDTLETLEILDGIVDVYMPDFKFFDGTAAARYLDAPDYPEVVVAGVEEMFRQVGQVRLGPDGTMSRGVLIRHLVMPGHLPDTRRILEHLANRYGSEVVVNVMGQYRPCGHAASFPEISRSLDHSEWVEARRIGADLGLMLA